MSKHVVVVQNFGQPAFTEVLAKRPDVRLHSLRRDTPGPEVAAVLGSAHAYHVSSGVNDVAPEYLVSPALLSRAPDLLLVSTMGAGYDSVDLAACTRAGVAVVNQSGGGNAEAVAEHVLAMMLCLSKRIVESDRHMRREAGIVRGDYVGHNALGKTVGIVGFGNVGTRLGELCRAALQMRVLVCDEHRSAGYIRERGAEKTDLNGLLHRSDFVAICCALTDETRGMIGAREFASMQKHAYFITAARGGIHDETALAEALIQKRIAGAGVDVWDVEPPPPGHPLLLLDTVVATPHIGGATVESRVEAAEGAARQILDALDGKRPPRLLNPEAWPAFCARFERIFGFRPEFTGTHGDSAQSPCGSPDSNSRRQEEP